MCNAVNTPKLFVNSFSFNIHSLNKFLIVSAVLGVVVAHSDYVGHVYMLMCAHT